MKYRCAECKKIFTGKGENFECVHCGTHLESELFSMPPSKNTILLVVFIPFIAIAFGMLAGFFLPPLPFGDSILWVIIVYAVYYYWPKKTRHVQKT